MIGGHAGFGRIVNQRMRARADLAFVRDQQIEDRKEGLPGGALSPVGVFRGFVPGAGRLLQVVVLFRVIRAVISGLAQIGGEHLPRGWHTGVRPHVLAAGGRRVDAADDGGPRGRADRGVRPGVHVDRSALAQLVQVGRHRIIVAAGVQVGTDILAGDPQEIRTGRRCRRCGSHPRGRCYRGGESATSDSGYFHLTVLSFQPRLCAPMQRRRRVGSAVLPVPTRSRCPQTRRSARAQNRTTQTEDDITGRDWPVRPYRPARPARPAAPRTAVETEQTT